MKVSDLPMSFPIRRSLILPLILSLLVQLLIPMQGFAAEDMQQQIDSAQEAKITLEQAVRIVKENFDIPQEYIEFTSGFSNYQSRQTWSLNWNASNGSGGNFTSQVDAVTGEILSMSSWKPSTGEQGYKLPGISLEQAKTIAANTVKKLAGQKYTHLKIIENRDIIPINLYGSTAYHFNWQRIGNGIPLQGNGASVQIDANDGQILSYSLTWNELTLPEVNGIISAQKAAEALTQNKLLELQYFLPPVYRIMAAGSKEQVQLIYQLQNNGVIDAFTGKPLLLNQDQWLSADAAAPGGLGSAKEKGTSNFVSLTPQEQKEIEKNITLLTKEKAIEVVKRWVDIPSNLTLKSMSLNTDGGLRDTKTWYFEWSPQSREQGQTITARVDAVNGELIGFNFYHSQYPLQQTDGQKSTLTKEAAQKIGEDFLKRIQPDKFKEVKIKLDPFTESSAKIVPVEINSFSFNYERIVNGISFASNGMSVAIDPVTKKVTSYNLNWWNVDFPQLSQALPQVQAESTFLKARPFELKYVLVYTNGEPKEAKLIYQPSKENNLVSDVMNAKTGAFLDWQGKPLSEQLRPYTFVDITGSDSEKEIAALGSAGIFGEYGNTFKPEENITAGSLLRALLIIRNGAWDNSGLTDDEVLKKTKEQGWLKEDLSPAQNVSRELFCKILIRYLNLEKIAVIDSIYRPSFEDIQQIPSQSQGYISLATGLGLVKVRDNQFEPDKMTTRSEAAYSIIQALGYGLR